jgi:exopolysaccharide production protein ExoZ
MYFKSIQMLRAFAAIFVVLFHLNFFWNKHGNFLPHLFDNMFGSIDLFFVISGFVLFQSAIKFKHGFRQFLIFIQKRLARLYAFYWIVMPLLVVTGLSYQKMNNWWQFLKSFFFIPSYLLVIFPTWTIIYEIYLD